jgi:hypothetical protein
VLNGIVWHILTALGGALVARGSLAEVNLIWPWARSSRWLVLSGARLPRVISPTFNW